mmetsp:Transcript_15068/g.47486  ORF Transcript_15068/g.47486 Transcript_15068/m.47486 type:complete len:233 (-) Transcript_15068:1982-2680(-)
MPAAIPSPELEEWSGPKGRYLRQVPVLRLVDHGCLPHKLLELVRRHLHGGGATPPPSRARFCHPARSTQMVRAPLRRSAGLALCRTSARPNLALLAGVPRRGLGARRVGQGAQPEQLAEPEPVLLKLLVIVEGLEGIHHVRNALRVALKPILGQHWALHGQGQPLPLHHELRSVRAMFMLELHQPVLELWITKASFQIPLQPQGLLTGDGRQSARCCLKIIHAHQEQVPPRA